MREEIKYKDWVLSVDYERTKQVYDNVSKGSPETCTCSPCQNFAANRENIYPQEIKDLLENPGIDYHKESEIYHMGKYDRGLYYGGWFHFKGSVETDTNTEKTNIPITDNFSIGFMKDYSLSYFPREEYNELVQVEFYVSSPWIIEKELEVD